MAPSTPEITAIEISESALLVTWSLEGAANTFHIWNDPPDGKCGLETNSVCELDVTESTLNITGLVPGQGQ